MRSVISDPGLVQRLRCQVLCALLCVAFAASAAAVPPATPPAGLSLRLSLVDRPSAPAMQQQTLDAGTVVAGRGARPREVVIRSRVALRLDGPGSSARTFVAMAQDFPGSSVRVDGRPVGPAPQLLNPAHRLGSIVVHQLEMTIGPEVPAGAFLSSLVWTAETD